MRRLDPFPLAADNAWEWRLASCRLARRCRLSSVKQARRFLSSSLRRLRARVGRIRSPVDADFHGAQHTHRKVHIFRLFLPHDSHEEKMKNQRKSYTLFLDSANGSEVRQFGKAGDLPA
jgi:hypothetical protein